MQNQTSLIPFILLGCLAMFGLIVVIILFVVTYQRKMLEKENKLRLFEQEKQIQLFKATVEAEDKQKERIAHNLHDSINPMLGLLKLNLSKHKIDITKNKFNVDDLKNDASIIDEIVEGIRIISKELSSSYMANKGLIGSIERHISIISSSSSLSVIYNNNLKDEDLNLNEQDKANTFRIFLELINNVLKHTKCSVFEVNLEKIDNVLLLRITHNGKGINNDDVQNLINADKGLGLKSLKSRTLMLNAKLDYQKTINTSSITLSVPLT